MAEQHPSPASRDFALLLQGLASEMNLLGHDFADAQGLHSTDVQALLAILRANGGQGVTPGKLREELALTSGAVTAVLDRLERAGHVRRTRDANDRRQVRVHHNPGATRMAGRWFVPVAERTELVRSEFSASELAVVVRFLSRMTEELEQLRADRRTGGRP
ncbi:MarR family winged helix-turn-helix transcriptional regulator [Kitasatospora sp. CMC57]|uniref:MarR family winged helix-turn-helix transcriptional regulator n=1 Tax=Kitasatospora sp. CMC57 TaxID=3231513 RepID=A0AB33JSG8_9ACTN